MVFEIPVPKQGIFDFQNEFCTQKQLLWSEFALLQLLINGFKTRRRGIVLCPNWGCCLKQGTYFMIFFCPKQGQRFKLSAAHLYPNIGPVPPPPPWFSYLCTISSLRKCLSINGKIKTLIDSHPLSRLSCHDQHRPINNFFRPFAQSAHYLKKNTALQRFLFSPVVPSVLPKHWSVQLVESLNGTRVRRHV